MDQSWAAERQQSAQPPCQSCTRVIQTRACDHSPAEPEKPFRITSTNLLGLEPRVEFVPCCYSQQERVRGRVRPAAPHQKGERGRAESSRSPWPGSCALFHPGDGLHGAGAWRGGDPPILPVFSLR